MYEPQRPLVFMHIAKSAGTSLNVALLDALAPKRPVTGFDRVMFGGFDAFDSLSDPARASVFDHPGQMPDGDFVHGHFSLSTTMRRYPDGQFVTVLREPSVRLLSLWRYWRLQGLATMAGWGRWIDVVARSQAPLATFLADPVVACQTDNMALRMLLWPHALIPDDGFIDPQADTALLRDVQDRLDRFAWIGLVEDETHVRSLGDWLGRPVADRRLNESSGGASRSSAPLEDDLTDTAFDLLEARSRLDQALWTAVARRRFPGGDVGRLRKRALIRAIARHAA